MLSSAPVLLPFAASRVRWGCWAAGPAFGPTQSDEGACQHLGEGGPRILLPGPVSCFKSHLRYLLHAFFFWLARIASYQNTRVCSIEESPPSCPAGRSAYNVRVTVS